MQTLDVLARLKRATTDRVPSTRTARRVGADGEFGLGDTCGNCGRDELSVTVDGRTVVPDEPAADRNRVSLCEDCHAATPTGPRSTAMRSFRQCVRDGHVVDADAIRERDDRRCRGCGVRERIVVGDDLHVHPVVPIDAGGYRHAHNHVCLCPTCHRRCHD